LKPLGREILKLHPKLGRSSEPLDFDKSSLHLLQTLQAIVVFDSAETKNSFCFLVTARVFAILDVNQESFGNNVEKSSFSFKRKNYEWK
jgi:hypothetical protein